MGAGRSRRTVCTIWYTVLFIVEGNLKDASFTFDTLLGAVVNAELTEGTHVFRTWDIRESTYLIEHLQKKMPLHRIAQTLWSRISGRRITPSRISGYGS